MRKMIAALYVVMTTLEIDAQNILQPQDPYCRKNKIEVIDCEADGKYQHSQQKIQIRIQNKASCFYYRYTDYGFWSIEIAANQKPVASLRSAFDLVGSQLQNYPWNFSVSELSANQPFEIQMDSSSVQIKKFQIYDSVGGCQPGSALTDDYCQQKSYSIFTERIDFENLKCQKSVQ